MVPKMYGSPIQEPISGKVKSSQTPRALVRTRKIGSQKVDPKFNELQSKFRTIYANIEALYHSCENYKTSVRSFFYNSINLIELFRLILEDATEDSHDCLTPGSALESSPIPMCEERQRTTEILEYFYATSGLPSNQRDFCISKLSKQMYAIARRLDEDFKFFDHGVQTPLKTVYQVCSNISRLISARNNASSEYMGLKERIAEYEYIMQNSHSRDNHSFERLEYDEELKDARAKFEILNQLLKNNLETFTELISKFMKEWFMIYYYSTLRITYALYHFSWTSPEFKKIALKGLTSPHHELISNSHILAQFHAQNDVVTREVEKLNIVDFDRFYKTSVETIDRIFMESFY